MILLRILVDDIEEKVVIYRKGREVVFTFDAWLAIRSSIRSPLFISKN